MPLMHSPAEPVALFPDPPGSFVRNMLYGLFRHKRSIMLVWLAAIVSALVYLGQVSPTYTAEAKLLVNLGREKMGDIGLQREPVMNALIQQRAQDVNNEVEILSDVVLMRSVFPQLNERLKQDKAEKAAKTEKPPSPPADTLLQKLRDQVEAAGQMVRTFIQDASDLIKSPLYQLGLLKAPGAGQELTADQQLMQKFYNALSVSTVKETDVINLGFDWDDPQFAAFALDTYLNEYEKQRLLIYTPKNPVTFFEAQLSDAEKQLADINTKLADFLRSSGISHLDTDKNLLLTTVTTLRSEMERSEIELQNAQIKLSWIEHSFQASGGWIETPDSVDAVAGTQALDQSFVSLFETRNKLLARFLPDAVQVRNVDNQIAKLRAQKYESLKSFYRTRVSALTDRVRLQQADIAAKERQLADLNERTVRHDNFQQERAHLVTLVADYKRKIEDLRVNADLNTQNFTSTRLIGRPVPPLRPSAPKKKLIFILAAVFGLLLGLAYAALLEFLDHTFRRPEHIVRFLRIPVLANVPDIVE